MWQNDSYFCDEMPGVTKRLVIFGRTTCFDTVIEKVWKDQWKRLINLTLKSNDSYNT